MGWQPGCAVKTDWRDLQGRNNVPEVGGKCGSGGSVPGCLAEAVLPALPCSRDVGSGDRPLLSAASSGTS